MKKVAVALLVALSLGVAVHTVETARPPRQANVSIVQIINTRSQS